MQIVAGACLTAITSTIGYVVSKGFGKEVFDSSQNFIDVSANENIGNEVDSSFAAYAKSSNKKKGNKAIKLVLLNSEQSKTEDNSQLRMAQIAAAKNKILR